VSPVRVSIRVVFFTPRRADKKSTDKNLELKRKKREKKEKKFYGEVRLVKYEQDN